MALVIDRRFLIEEDIAQVKAEVAAETEAIKENTGKFVMIGGGVLIVLLGVALKLFSAGSVSPWKAVVPLYNMAAGFGIDEAPRKWVAVGVTGAVSLLMFVVAYLGYIISQP